MHELGVASEVLRVCRASAGSGCARLERVTLAVGELSAVEPDLLRFAWEAATAGSPDAGAVLEIEWRPARQVCEACGDIAERATGSWLRLCPRCERPLRVEGGQELDVLHLSYEERETPADRLP